MSAVASLADKATKTFAVLCAGATVAGVTTLIVNVYYNTGKHRKAMPSPQAVEGEGQSNLSSQNTTTDSKGV